MTLGFLGAAAAMIAVGLFSIIRTRSFLKRAVDAEGLVVGMKTSSTSKGTSHSPITEYKTADGVVHRITESSGSSHPGVQVGDTVPVKYDPAEPAKGRLAKPYYLWGFGGFFVFLGLIFAIAAVAIVPS